MEWHDTDEQRLRIMVLVRDLSFAGLPPQMEDGMPMWRRVIWAMLHPFKFGKAYGEIMLAHRIVEAIQRRDYLQGQGHG